MHTLTLRLDQRDARTLAWLAAYHSPDKLRGMPFSDVIRLALREARRVAEAEIAVRKQERKKVSP